MIEKVKETKSLNLSALTIDRAIEANQEHGREHEGMNIETKSIPRFIYLLIALPWTIVVHLKPEPWVVVQLLYELSALCRVEPLINMERISIF